MWNYWCPLVDVLVLDPPCPDVTVDKFFGALRLRVTFDRFLSA